MLLANLSSHERKLYILLAQACGGALVLGLLTGLVSFSDAGKDRGDNWQASQLIAASDSLAEFAAISDQPRWFVEGGVVNPAQAAEAAKKALEGQPESLKLIGIVERSGTQYALFIPVNATAASGSGPKGVVQFATGDTLAGDWKVKEISQSTVTVVATKESGEQEVRELSLYQSKK